MGIIAQLLQPLLIFFTAVAIHGILQPWRGSQLHLHPAAGNDTVPKSPVPLLNRIDIKGERGEFSAVYSEGGNQLK